MSKLTIGSANVIPTVDTATFKALFPTPGLAAMASVDAILTTAANATFPCALNMQVTSADVPNWAASTAVPTNGLPSGSQMFYATGGIRIVYDNKFGTGFVQLYDKVSAGAPTQCESVIYDIMAVGASATANPLTWEYVRRAPYPSKLRVLSGYAITVELVQDCYKFPDIAAAQTVTCDMTRIGNITDKVITLRIYFKVTAVAAVTWPADWVWIYGTAPSLTVADHCVAVERAAGGPIRANLCY